MGLEDFSEDIDWQHGYNKRNYCEACDERTFWKRAIMFIKGNKVAMYECNRCGYYSTRDYLNQMERKHADNS